MSTAQKVAYQQSVETNEQSMRCFFAALAYLGQPGSFNDIGCGDGHLVELASSLDIPSWGIDLNVESQKIFLGEIQQGDITARGQKFPKADLTFCLEVAEHLPKEFARKLGTILNGCTKKMLIFSAAIPGQGGSGHLNERPLEYWRDLLEERGFKYIHLATMELTQMWKIVAPEAWWYSQNLQVFKKR